MRNNVILCLGSNTDCEANLKSAVGLLRGYFGTIRFSEAAYTEPVGLPGSGLFLNQVAVAGTEASQEEVERALKDMEKRLGRMPDSKQKGQIPIDIDLLFWNGTILKPADWEKEYVQLLFRSVADGCHDDERGDAYSPSTGAHDQFIGDSGTPAL
ncbi:2-amino-4-hydroxy-6-hydroxymethyldihydropteridine diphosphokinase [Parabacteroides hominis]|uniref:2-amino-4-hydroxy-6-hydroxymethyldihydropteridine pyrophosphokinase n=1 Tax=Parabacteroides hominis TaxID=2763057 RepID=A0ABR7DUG5_9BACT|nr:2-amino-4-hydroxy-6-hydroxymethyldihydropteridine diphosphokinase [Parabacteroides hominis]MBC5634458.1 2-amino-4-hydroxy-6-hydroxymethyldihydropteridine diphosphokinase [Parabacteroides hominis]